MTLSDLISIFSLFLELAISLLAFKAKALVLSCYYFLPLAHFVHLPFQAFDLFFLPLDLRCLFLRVDLLLQLLPQQSYFGLIYSYQSIFFAKLVLKRGDVLLEALNKLLSCLGIMALVQLLTYVLVLQSDQFLQSRHVNL